MFNFDSAEDFVLEVSRVARDICTEYGILTSFYLSQCGLETDFGCKTKGQFNFTNMRDKDGNIANFQTIEEGITEYCKKLVKLDCVVCNEYAEDFDPILDYIVITCDELDLSEEYLKKVIELRKDWGFQEYDV